MSFPQDFATKAAKMSQCIAQTCLNLWKQKKGGQITTFLTIPVIAFFCFEMIS